VGGFVWLAGGVDGGVPVEAAGVAVAEPFAVAADDAVAFPVLLDEPVWVVLVGGSLDAVVLSLVLDGDGLDSASVHGVTPSLLPWSAEWWGVSLAPPRGARTSAGEAQGQGMRTKSFRIADRSGAEFVTWKVFGPLMLSPAVVREGERPC